MNGKLLNEERPKRSPWAKERAKRKYDSQDTKRRLLKAGINVFSKQGYDAATTREIARQADVNLCLISRYFDNKLGLFFAIIREFHDHLISTPPYPPGESLREELTQFFRYRMEFAHKHRKLMRITISRAILDPKAKEELGELAKTGMPWLTARLEKLRANGKIRKDNDLEKASQLISSITFAMSMFTEIAFNMDPEYSRGVLEQAIGTLCDGLCPK
jgi:TetR/AcrR family transcriptional regulator, regulator of cefoperazone and chloramphenicol sensitivity